MVRRSPAQIGSLIRNNHPPFSVDGLVDRLQETVSETFAISNETFGLLLSGGVDSSVLALLMKPWNTPCFTIGRSIDSPDILAAMKLAKENDINLYVHIPSSEEIKKVKERVTTDFPGDENVLIALEFSSKFISSLFATEGIDELMGGYWWHLKKTEYCSTIEEAFEYSWNHLESDHLTPMFEAAKQTNMNIHWIYLQPYISDYIAGLPFEKRIENGNKSIWKEVAKKIGVPQWVIDRPKKGFVDALS